MSGPLDDFLSRAMSDCVEGYAAGIRDDAHDLALGKSPHETREMHEREPGPAAAPPDPKAQAALFRRTAAMLRRNAARTADASYERQCDGDALYFERRAAELEEG